ncbi:MAG TPA: hypothetical protein VK892_09815 [Pyrinomonadaceae bacterium]|nr:hypothetical protein [Pyrinomonadaceae bacterium]
MRFFLSLCAVFWLFAAIGGVIYLARYENTPAEKNNSYPSVFPPESRIERDAGRLTLVFFAHPKCPCTRASLRELSRLMTEVDDKLQVFVVFNKPRDESGGWTETDLRESAEAIPNARVLIDENERETDIFNARTSGLALLYDREGNLRFNGGITASRGHEGDNAGRNAIFEIVTKEADKTAETFVFGCSLQNEDYPKELMQNAQ